MTARIKHPTTVDMFTLQFRRIETEKVSFDEFQYWGVTSKKDVDETIEFGPFDTCGEANQAIDNYLWKDHLPKKNSASEMLMGAVRKGQLKR